MELKLIIGLHRSPVFIEKMCVYPAPIGASYRNHACMCSFNASALSQWGYCFNGDIALMCTKHCVILGLKSEKPQNYFNKVQF
jgi:hypothetical protein